MSARRVWPALAALVLVAAPQIARPAPIVAWTYTVKPGDTLAAIAARMGVSPGDLARANAIDLDLRLVAGTVLKRPDPDDRPPAARHTVRRAPLPRAEPGAPRLVWPTSGAVTARFGAVVHSKPDKGIDLAAFAGMTVRAAAAGRVIFAGTEPERFGKLIVIDHGGGWATAYAYLGKVTVSEGATVRGGTPIARIGASGEAKKPMLHFELRHDNVPQDPLPALPIRL